jgi:hypothetical protein
MNIPGIVSFNGQFKSIETLTVEELVEYLFSKLTGRLVHGSGKVYSPAQQFGILLVYFHIGTKAVSKLLTSDQGLRSVAMELRSRLDKGEWPNIDAFK